MSRRILPTDIGCGDDSLIIYLSPRIVGISAKGKSDRHLNINIKGRDIREVGTRVRSVAINLI